MAVRGGTVRPHVARFAVDSEAATGYTYSFGTYPGHSPSIDRALDGFVPNRTTAAGYALCEFALNNWAKYGLRYIIFRQQINYNDGRGWLWMEDRGSDTQNHFDHVHLAFEETAELEGEDMALSKEQDDTLHAIYDNVKNVGALLHNLGNGDWEKGAFRLFQAVEKIERLDSLASGE